MICEPVVPKIPFVKCLCSSSSSLVSARKDWDRNNSCLVSRLQLIVKYIASGKAIRIYVLFTIAVLYDKVTVGKLTQPSVLAVVGT